MRLRSTKRLVNRFDYDEVWGTALNRFCVQAAIGPSSNGVRDAAGRRAVFSTSATRFAASR